MVHKVTIICRFLRRQVTCWLHSITEPKVVYPTDRGIALQEVNDGITVRFPRENMACILEGLAGV